jgi:hypothetical protein
MDYSSLIYQTLIFETEEDLCSDCIYWSCSMMETALCIARDMNIDDEYYELKMNLTLLLTRIE